MKANKSIWMHSDFPGKQYKSHFKTVIVNKNGEPEFEQRLFVLTHVSESGKKHSVEFGDFRYAQKAGWVKVK